MKDDLISRQAAVEAIQIGWDYTNDQIRALQKLPPAQQWIPCSERLPEENGRYLVTNSAWGAMEVDWNAWVDGAWLYPNTMPIAWMPLPEPYKAESGAKHENSN